MPYPTTQNLGLSKPPDGDTGWGQAMRDNLDVVDGIASIERQVAATTPTLGFYQTALLEVSLSQAADLTVLTTDHPAWVRVYGSAAARTEDAARLITTKVTDGRGCYGDAITYLPDGLTLTWSEVPTFQNLDTPRTGTAYLAVTSMDPAYSGPINLTFTFRERGPRTGALQGLAGLDGHTILALTRDPVATDGHDGDVAINTLAWTVFAPKAAGAWPAGVSLVGPAGANGTNGTNGVDGIQGPPGVSAFTRQTASYTTAVLAPGATESTGSVALRKVSDLLTLATDYPAWVRVYGTAAQRTADASRLITADPAPGAGVFADVATTAAKPSIPMSPVPVFVNGDSPVADTGYLAITNRDTVARAITLTLTYLPQEA